MFPQRENQAIAGIYDLLEIILEKLNRIEHNQEKDRISRAFGGAYNVNHQPIDALSRARPELQSRNNYRHTSSLLSAPDLVQNQTCSVLIPNNSPSASKPTEESSSGEDNENNIKMQRGLEKENDDVEQRKYQISLGQHAEGQQKQVDPSVALGRKEKRKLQQEDVGSKRQQKPKKCRQEDTNDDEEHESTKEMLFTEEMLFVEEEETDEEEESLRKKLETTLKKKKSRREQKARLQQEQEDARLHKEQEDRLRKEEQDKLQRERNTTLKYSRSKQGMKETSKATPNGEDTLLEGEIALNSTTRSSQKEKRVVVQTEQMKRRRELQTLTRRRRSVIVKKGQQANTGNNPVGLTIKQSDFKGSSEIHQLLNFIKHQLKKYCEHVHDKRKIILNIEGRADSIYKHMAIVTKQVLRNHQNTLEHCSWDRISADLQEEILVKIEYQVQERYERIGIAFNDCIDHWPSRIITKHLYPTFKLKRAKPVIELRKPVVEPNLDDDDDTIAD